MKCRSCLWEQNKNTIILKITYQPFKRQFQKTVKHAQTIRREIA